MSSELWLGYVVEDDMPETAKHKETNTRKRTALAGCHIRRRRPTWTSR